MTKVCELLMYNKSKMLQNTMNAVVDLKNSQVVLEFFLSFKRNKMATVIIAQEILHYRILL